MPSKKLTTQLVQGAHTAFNSDSQSAIMSKRNFIHYTAFFCILQELHTFIDLGEGQHLKILCGDIVVQIDCLKSHQMKSISCSILI